MNPNYYAVITADVRYDNRLNAQQKLIYAEITALSNATGECWATNGYFAKLYDVSSQTVSRWIRALVECGYITSDVERNDRNEVVRRVLRICPPVENDGTPTVENDGTPPLENGGTPPVKNEKENNTSIFNITSSNKNKYDLAFSAKDVMETHLNVAVGGMVESVIGFMNEICGTRFKMTSKTTERLILARMREGYGLDDFKAVIKSRFEAWGNDERMRQYLRPRTLFGTKFEDYLQAASGSRMASGEGWF